MIWKKCWEAVEVLRRVRATPRRSVAHRHRIRPAFEELEDRSVPAVYTWTGATAGTPGGNGWWSNVGNWHIPSPTGPVIPGAPPGVNDDVKLDGTGATNNPLVDQSFTGTINKLTINHASVQLTLTRSLTVNADFTQSNGTITANGNTLTAAGGTFDWTGGGMSNPSLSIASGVTFNKSAAASQNGGSITNAGTFNLLENASAVSVTNNGTLKLHGGNTISVSVTNNGTLNQSAGTNTIHALDNKGSLVLNAGLLKLNTSAKQSGAGASTTFNGAELELLANITFLLQAGNLFGSANGSRIWGHVNNSGGTIYAGGTTGTLEMTHYTQGSGGTLNIGVDVNGGKTAKLKAATVNLAGTLTINWTNGTPAAGSEWEICDFGLHMGDFATFSSMGSATPTYTHMAGTWSPYKIKVD